MRGLIAGQRNPLPVGDGLPSVLLTDKVVTQFCSGLDEVLAPIVCTLDSWPAYLDPDTTPRDMLAWLGSWLGVTLDARQSAEQQREVLRRSVRLLRWRGTLRGLREAVALVAGVEP